MLYEQGHRWWNAGRSRSIDWIMLSAVARGAGVYQTLQRPSNATWKKKGAPYAGLYSSAERTRTRRWHCSEQQQNSATDMCQNQSAVRALDVSVRAFICRRRRITCYSLVTSVYRYVAWHGTGLIRSLAVFSLLNNMSDISSIAGSVLKPGKASPSAIFLSMRFLTSSIRRKSQ